MITISTYAQNDKFFPGSVTSVSAVVIAGILQALFFPCNGKVYVLELSVTVMSFFEVL